MYTRVTTRGDARKKKHTNLLVYKGCDFDTQWSAM